MINPFDSESDLRTLCQIVRAVAEEWGQENLKMLLPRIWSKNAQIAESFREFQFVTENSIVLSVELAGQEGHAFRRELIIDQKIIDWHRSNASPLPA